MSNELKVYHCNEWHNEYTEFYVKSEVDKVIAELKKACNDKDDWCLHTLKENRHHKYKRCLAMAEMCERKRIDAANYRIPRKKWEFYYKWHKRWLELAEVFKTIGDN